MQTVILKDLGNMHYKEAWDLQEELLQQNLLKKKEASLTSHFFLMVEHPPVYTLGKSGKEEHVLISNTDREQKGIEYFKINRGGDITFHGPGQIVGYPILDLELFFTDIGRYLRNLEEVIILTLAEYGIRGERSTGETGVWIEPGIKGRERKICAMGVRCSRWITMHGFAFNVNTDLSYFDYIVPCGIHDKEVTSLQKELGRPLSMDVVKQQVQRNFEKVFNVKLETIKETNPSA
ncbi:MAG TPA: lipoyl(octanoyl) transferase LipB [Chitinophagaceae bacterium]|nr:lipoyl(octanoyl) transferase LipB [Chitinophagaceae bacterium]